MGTIKAPEDLSFTQSTKTISAPSSACPLIGWELIKLNNDLLELAKLQGAGAIALSLIKEFLVGPLAGALIDAIQDGADIVDAALDRLADLINTVSARDWMFYAISATAREVHGAAGREIEMLNTVLQLMKRLTVQKKAKSNRYKRMSTRAKVNIRAIITRLNAAQEARTATRLLSLLSDAERLANSNIDLLASNASGYRRASLSLADINGMIEERKQSKTDGAIKDVGRLGDRHFISLLRDGASRIRGELADNLGDAIRRYIILTKILYMYAGIDYVRVAAEYQRRHRDIIAMIDVYGSATRDGDSPGANIFNYEYQIDEALSALAEDVKRQSLKTRDDIRNHMGYYLVSMSPEYDIYDKTVEGLGGYPFGDHSPAMSAIMSASPFSPVPNDTLTIYGASTKLMSSIEAFNMLVAQYEEYGSGVKFASPAVAMDKGGDETGKLERLKNKTGEIDVNEEAYAFDDSMGLAGARYDATWLKQSISAIRRSSEGSAQAEKNEAYSARINNAYPLELSNSEPALGIAITLRLIVPYATIPFYNSEPTLNELSAAISERISYLRRITSATQPLLDYTDASCERVLDELMGSGFPSLADACKYGQVAMGAVSVSTAIAGGAAALGDLFNNCVLKSDMAIDNWKKTQAGLNRLKKTAEDTIRKALDKMLKLIDYNMSLIDSLLLNNKKIEDAKATINKMKAAAQKAMEAVAGENVPI